MALAVVPTGSMKAYAHEMVTVMTRINGFIPKSSANRSATGISIVAVADVRITSINRVEDTDSRTMSTPMGRKPTSASCWPISLDSPEV